MFRVLKENRTKPCGNSGESELNPNKDNTKFFIGFPNPSKWASLQMIFILSFLKSHHLSSVRDLHSVTEHKNDEYGIKRNFIIQVY